MPATRHAGGRPRTIKRSRVGNKIEQLAELRGVHLDELAARSGIAYTSLHKIITGETSSPRWNTLKALADALKIAPQKLME